MSVELQQRRMHARMAGVLAKRFRNMSDGQAALWLTTHAGAWWATYEARDADLLRVGRLVAAMPEETQRAIVLKGAK